MARVPASKLGDQCVGSVIGMVKLWLLGTLRRAALIAARATESLEAVVDYAVFCLVALARLPSVILAKFRGSDDETVSDFLEQRMRAVFAALAYPFHWLRHRFSSPSAADENSVTEYVESRIGKALFFVTYPYHLFRHRFNSNVSADEEGISDVVESRVGSLLFFLTFPYHWIQSRFTARGETASEYIESRVGFIFFLARLPYRWLRHQLMLLEAKREASERNSFLSGLLWWLFAPPFYTLHVSGQVYEFAGDWLYSRNLRGLIGGIPAIALALPVIVTLVLTSGPFQAAQINHYRATLSEAVKDDNDALAKICFGKLEQLRFEKAERAQFSKVILLASKEKYEQAYEIAKELAPQDEPGYLEAHIWIAGAFLYQLIDDPNRWDEIETHLRHANSINAEHPIARRLTAELHLHHGQLEQAKELMETVVHIYPEFHSFLMQIHFENDDLLPAMNHAKGAIRFFEEMTTAEEPLELMVSDYERWAHSYHLAGDAKGEYRVLAKALRKFPDHELLRSRRQQVLDERIKNEPISDETLKEFVAIDPHHRGIWNTLAARELAGDESAHRLIEELRRDEVMPADFYLLLGDTHFSEQEYSQAREFYEIAVQTDAATPFAWNNIAWILANVEPRNLSRALECADRAIELHQDPRFNETRGQIHMQLEQFEAAIVDLQKAVNGDFPEMADVHRALAIAYRHLGEHDLSRAHERSVDSP